MFTPRRVRKISLAAVILNGIGMISCLAAYIVNLRASIVTSELLTHALAVGQGLNADRARDFVKALQSSADGYSFVLFGMAICCGVIVLAELWAGFKPMNDAGPWRLRFAALVSATALSVGASTVGITGYNAISMAQTTADAVGLLAGR